MPDVWLAFAPVKRNQTDWLIEKATELGAARLIPVMTQRTIAERVKLERLEAIAIEAAEQCGRTRLPAIEAPVPLAQLLKQADRTLYFADEGGGEPAASTFRPGPSDDPHRPRRRLHRRGAGHHPRSAQRRRLFRSGRASCARRRRRWLRLPPIWRVAGDWR